MTDIDSEIKAAMREAGSITVTDMDGSPLTYENALLITFDDQDRLAAAMKGEPVRLSWFWESANETLPRPE